MAKMLLDTGTTIDGFLLDERLHRGAVAAIWRVSHPDIDFPIVMKVPSLEDERALPLMVRFEVEQMIMAELAGVHVPRFIASGTFNVLPHIVMEYVAGPTLATLLADQTPMRLDDVIGRATAMSDAIGELHQQHVLHLDLKPANVLFRDTGEAVIIDFGLSRHEQLPDLLGEQNNRATGTTTYMAPEQLLRVRSDKRSDIFALGVIIYQMATGELPFGKPERIKDVRQRAWRDPVPPRKLRAEIGAGLQEVILKCLEPLPDRRYATAEELSFDLRHLDLVTLTDRAERRERADFQTAFGRWMRVRQTMKAIAAAATQPPPRAPLILAVVELGQGLESLRHALLEASVSVMANTPGARLACLNVMQTSSAETGAVSGTAGDSPQLSRIAELRAWAAPLQLPRGKITYHVMEARNTAGGIRAFARLNRLEHLVVGALTPDGAAASPLELEITAVAPCPVTVVRGARDATQ